ncbi:TPA: glyoxalase [Vibrio vulnificus]|nr:glyoxalase [Vibrio vulnificus]
MHDNAWVTGTLETPLGRGVNFQIELSDIAPVYERLESAGVSLFKEQKDTWYDVGDSLSGQREFLVQDPDGYLLRFSQYLGEKSKP